MPQPSTLPVWDTDDDNLVEPSAGQQATGWTVNQVPPSSYFNWWMNLVYQWCLWLSTLFTTAHTWTMAQVFSAGAEVSGTGLEVTGGCTIDYLIPTALALVRHAFSMAASSSFVYTADASLGEIFAVTAINAGGGKLCIPATVAGGAAVQLPVGTILTIKDESGTANARNVQFVNPAAGNTTNVDGSGISLFLNTNYQTIRLYYAGSAGGVDSWYTI